MEAEVNVQQCGAARDVLVHAQDGAFLFAQEAMQIDAALYSDPERFRREKQQLFRRLPLMLAVSAEIPAPGDYKTVDIAGVSVLISRGKDGIVRAFLNTCPRCSAHVAEGSGNASRFSCKDHGWTFTCCGTRISAGSADGNEAAGKPATKLPTFPVFEKDGLIWAVLDAGSQLDIPAFLSGYDRLLGDFGLENWQLIGRRVLKGANWKLGFDAQFGFCSLYSTPRQRPKRTRATSKRRIPGVPATAGTAHARLLGEWILLPNVSVSCFHYGLRGVVISQVFPGEEVNESLTVQTYLMENTPEEPSLEETLKMTAFLAQTMNDQDLLTSLRQQCTASSLLPHAVDTTGCGGEGVEGFHRWIQRIVEAEDTQLGALFPA